MKCPDSHYEYVLAYRKSLTSHVFPTPIFTTIKFKQIHRAYKNDGSVGKDVCSQA